MQQSSLAISDHFNQPNTWRAKIPFEVIQGQYTVKVADSIFEFQQVLELRKQVFLREFASQEIEEDSDFEPVDLEADFIIVLENQEIIASYRLIYSDFSDNFYSNEEFNLELFLADSENALELSRACVQQGRRTGIAIHLLWRGIAEYMIRSGAKLLFGCSSVQTLDLDLITKIYRFLQEQNVLADEFNIHPRSHFQLINRESLIQETKLAKRQALPGEIPTLFLSYIKAGAKVYGIPAVDLRFGCIDFFTVLRYEDLSNSYLRKYICRTNS